MFVLFIIQLKKAKILLLIFTVMEILMEKNNKKCPENWPDKNFQNRKKISILVSSEKIYAFFWN